MGTRSAAPLGHTIRDIVLECRTEIVKWPTVLGGGQQAAKPGVVSLPGKVSNAVPLVAATDSDHRDLSSAATPATTARSEAITGVGQPAWKAIMGFRASAVEDSAAAASAVEDFTAAGGGGNDE